MKKFQALKIIKIIFLNKIIEIHFSQVRQNIKLLMSSGPIETKRALEFLILILICEIENSEILLEILFNLTFHPRTQIISHTKTERTPARDPTIFNVVISFVQLFIIVSDDCSTLKVGVTSICIIFFLFTVGG